MGRDLLTMTGTALAIALMAWSNWGNPEEHSGRHLQNAQWIKADSEMKRISGPDR